MLVKAGEVSQFGFRKYCGDKEDMHMTASMKSTYEPASKIANYNYFSFMKTSIPQCKVGAIMSDHGIGRTFNLALTLTPPFGMADYERTLMDHK